MNFRLVRASQYLFEFNLIVKHKFDKFNIILDTFSRFQNDINVSINEKIDVLKTLYDVLIEFYHENLTIITSLLSKQSIYYIILIKMTNEFKQRLKQTYQNDSLWKKIFDLIRFLDVSCTRTINDRESIVITSSKTFTTSRNLSKRLKSIIIVIVNDETTSNKFDLRFKFRQNLIYFVVDDERERLYVSISLKQKIFQLIHD